MKDYDVTVSLVCTYRVSATNEEIAKDIAYEYFNEAIPLFDVNEVNEND